MIAMQLNLEFSKHVF